MSQFKKDAKVAGYAGAGAGLLAAIGPVADTGMGLAAAKAFEATAPHINPLLAAGVVGGATLVGKGIHSLRKISAARKAHMADAATKARR